MKLKHIGLVCSTEKNADRFYRDVLGLTKNNHKTLPTNLSKAIFNIDSELIIINYANDDIHFEIFIDDKKKQYSEIIEHICIEVDDCEKFLNNCKSFGVKTIKIQKELKRLVFIVDFDNHLFEIKEK